MNRHLEIIINHNDDEVQLHMTERKNGIRKDEVLISLPSKDTNSVKQILVEMLNMMNITELNVELHEVNEDKMNTLGEW